MGVSCYQAIVPGFVVMEKVAGGGETDGQMGMRSHQAIVPGFMAMEKVAGGGEMDGCEMSLSYPPWTHGGKGS